MILAVIFSNNKFDHVIYFIDFLNTWKKVLFFQEKNNNNFLL